MTGLDTNVLVRFLVGDDPRQSPAAERFLKTRCSPENPCWIGVIVLCEVVWVLQRGYHYPRTQIAAVIRQLLETAEFEIEGALCVRQALSDFAAGRADFADALIGRRNAASGAELTGTFDKKAADLPGFQLIQE